MKIKMNFQNIILNAWTPSTWKKCTSVSTLKEQLHPHHPVFPSSVNYEVKYCFANLHHISPKSLQRSEDVLTLLQSNEAGTQAGDGNEHLSGRLRAF